MHQREYISVVMATYNDELFIEEAIRSILLQSYQNFEFIIINDGSSDGTLGIIKKYAEMDSRIRFISRENQGLSESLNEAYELAQGEWIARMDADDISAPNRLEKQLAWIQSQAADICGTWIELFGTQCRIKRYYIEDRLIKKELLFGSPMGHATILVRASLAKSLKYDQKFKHAEDYDYFERAVQMGWKFTNIPEVLYHYRFHNKQTSSARFDEQQLASQKVRFRHWNSMASFYKLNIDEIRSVVSIRNKVPNDGVNIGNVNNAFEKILLKSADDERELVLLNMLPLYFRIAGRGITVYLSLNDLIRKYHKKMPKISALQLLFLGIFNIQANSFIFRILQRMYLKYSK